MRVCPGCPPPSYAAAGTGSSGTARRAARRCGTRHGTTRHRQEPPGRACAEGRRPGRRTSTRGAVPPLMPGHCPPMAPAWRATVRGAAITITMPAACGEVVRTLCRSREDPGGAPGRRVALSTSRFPAFTGGQFCLAAARGCLRLARLRGASQLPGHSGPQSSPHLTPAPCTAGSTAP
jgi:hypothetical protein